VATGELHQAVQHFRRAALLRDGASLSDDQLLERFVNRGDGAAFEAIVRRHGPLVLGVCRRVLRHRHDAEDAFQAVFLVLARKAGAIASPELLANWLYGVAYNTARKAGAAAARRRRRERQVAEMPEPEVPPPDVSGDLSPLLDEELQRLPDKYRIPVVLCDLQGKTRKEAARQLGWPEGTLSGRLSRARLLLAGRLTRRGVALSAGALAAALGGGAAVAAVPPAVLTGAVRAATLSAAGQAVGVLSPRIVALAEGVLQAMSTPKLTPVTGLLLGVVLLATAAGGLGLRAGQGAAPALPTAPNEGGIGKLVERLGSPKFREREAATRALAAIGEPALPVLRALAASGKDLETRRRAEQLIQLIESRWELRRFLGHTDAVPSVAISPDGRLVLSAGRSESSPRLWDVATGKEVRRFVGHGYWVWAVDFSPDGKRAVSGGVDGLRLWDVATGKELRRFTGHSRQVYRVAYGPDGKRVLSAGQDGTVRIWDVETGKQLLLFGKHTSEVFGVALSPDGKRGVSCGGEAVRLWDAETGRELRRFPGDHSAAFSPDGRSFLSGGRDNVMRLWEVASGRQRLSFRGHTKVVCSVAFSPDGRRALSGGDDGTVRVWDVATGKELRCLRVHGGNGLTVVFAPGGRRALSAGYDRTIRLWQLPK
jgi:RNA polymerase sigma factor (sigma-70 family)